MLVQYFVNGDLGNMYSSVLNVRGWNYQKTMNQLDIMFNKPV